MYNKKETYEIRNRRNHSEFDIKSKLMTFRSTIACEKVILAGIILMLLGSIALGNVRFQLLLEKNDGQVLLDTDSCKIEQLDGGRFQVDAFIRFIPSDCNATKTQEVTEHLKFTFPLTQLDGVISGDKDSLGLIFPIWFSEKPELKALLKYLKESEAFDKNKNAKQ